MCIRDRDRERRLQDEDIALAACVHNAGARQHGVEVDRVRPVSYTHLDVYKRQGMAPQPEVVDIFRLKYDYLSLIHI